MDVHASCNVVTQNLSQLIINYNLVSNLICILCHLVLYRFRKGDRINLSKYKKLEHYTVDYLIKS